MDDDPGEFEREARRQLRLALLRILDLALDQYLRGERPPAPEGE